jgi:hypothetical protein
LGLAGLIQSQLDETSFLQSGDFDPIIDGTVVQKILYFNVDIGASYNYLDFYMHGTVKCHRNQEETPSMKVIIYVFIKCGLHIW